MRFLKYLYVASVLIALASCEKEINFKYHDIEEQQVIEGLLSQDGARVSLTKTVATDEPFKDNIVTEATVEINDLTDHRIVSLFPDDTGIFTCSGFTGVVGHDYELTVREGEKQYSCKSRMLAPTQIVSAEFNWIKMPYDDVAVLKVQFKEDEDPDTQYWLRIYRNGEIYEWQAIESRNAQNGLVTGMMLTSRKDTEQEDDEDVLREGDVVDIEVMPISKKMADYLNSLNNGDYNGNRMFEGSYCLGYFLAAPVTETRLIYHPSEIPYAKNP